LPIALAKKAIVYDYLQPKPTKFAMMKSSFREVGTIVFRVPKTTDVYVPKLQRCRHITQHLCFSSTHALYDYLLRTWI